MPELGVTMAAGRRVRMLASVADRDRTIRILQASFVEGRLAIDEFEQRLGVAIAARDFRELLALTADLPARRSDRLPAHRVTPRAGPRRSRSWLARRDPRDRLGLVAWGYEQGAGARHPRGVRI